MVCKFLTSGKNNIRNDVFIVIQSIRGILWLFFFFQSSISEDLEGSWEQPKGGFTSPTQQMSIGVL